MSAAPEPPAPIVGRLLLWTEQGMEGDVHYALVHAGGAVVLADGQHLRVGDPDASPLWEGRVRLVPLARRWLLWRETHGRDDGRYSTCTQQGLRYARWFGFFADELPAVLRAE